MRNATTGIILILFLVCIPGSYAFAGHLDHMRSLIARAQDLLAISEVRAEFSEEDLALVESTAREAETQLKAGNYARAWQLLTHWRFWTLVNDEMEKHRPRHPWLVIGPFLEDKGSREVEQDALSGAVDATRRYTGVAGSGPVEAAWRRTASELKGGNDRIDIDNILADRKASAYAYSSVYSPEQQDAVLGLGSRNAVVLWVNGKQAAAHARTRAESPWQENVKITLRKGWNPLLMRVSHAKAEWGVTLGLRNQEGEVLSGLQFSDEILPCGDYSLKFKGARLDGLWWKGEPLLTTHYFMLNCSDVKTRRSVGKWRLTDQPMTMQTVANGNRVLLWEGFADQEQKYIYLRQTVELLPKKVVMRYEYETRSPLLPQFWTDDPARAFNRKDGRYQMRLFYLLLKSFSPILWDTHAEVRQGDKTQRHEIPKRDTAKRITLASGKYTEVKTVVLHTPQGPFSYEAEAQKMDHMSFYYNAYKYQSPEPIWFMGISDCLFEEMDIIPAGYSNTVTVTLGLGGADDSASGTRGR